MDKRILIAIGVLILIVLGFLAVSSSGVTGSVISGSAVLGEVSQNDVFRISDFGQDNIDDKEVLNGKG